MSRPGGSAYRPGSNGFPDGEESYSPSYYRTKTCRLLIRYYANGASGSPPSDSIATYSGEYKEVTLKRMVAGCPVGMTWQGHYFLGWSTSAGSSTIAYSPGDIITKKWESGEYGVTTYNLYAVWSTTGRIIYKPGQYADEASAVWHDKYQNNPGSGTITLRSETYHRTGYVHSGWQTNATPPVSVGDVGGSYSPSSSGEIVLYPVWTANTYNVVCYPNGENGSGSFGFSVQYNGELTLPLEVQATREGYHIAFWNEAADGSKSSWFPGQTYTFTRTEDITLYAIWKGNEYYVVYDENDGQSDDSDRVMGIINYRWCKKNSSGLLYSDSEDYPLELLTGDLLYTSSASFIVDLSTYSNYAIATYGEPFYTEYRPRQKENYSFAGWQDQDGVRWVKKGYSLDSYSLASDPTWNKMENVVLRPVWSGNYPFGKIFFGRKESSDYGIIIEKPPEYSWPEKEFSHKEIKGRNGDRLSDTNRYKNVQKKYQIAVYNKDGYDKAVSDLSTFLHRYNNYSDYLRIQDTYEPDIYMLGVYEESNSVSNILGQAGECEITFECLPQKYLISGSTKINAMDYESIDPQTNEPSIILRNPTDYPALPIIRIAGTGIIKFYGRPERNALGGLIDPNDYGSAKLETVVLYVLNNYNEILLDCETLNAVDINGKNMNQYISLDRRIALYPGPNGITYSGNIQEIDIIPRWWRL